MFFNPEISSTIVLLLTSGAVLAAVAIVYVALQSRRLARARRFDDYGDSREEAVAWEPVSVIVYSQDEAEALDTLLRSVLAQDYPAPMEVIVVNEGESSDVRDVVAVLRAAHDNIYLTHTPDGARSLSRKKLALTLGIKAARYATVVLTTVGAEIRSEKWLRGMMRHFEPGGEIEVVIGYAGPLDGADEGRGARCRAFDAAVSAARWLGAAIGGHPFRASEMNVAYRREAFFRNKGFSRSLNLHFGDDDIFISEIAHAGNTAVELSEESIVGVLSHDYRRTLREAAERRAFTESHIRRRPMFWCAFASLCVPAATLCVAAAVALDCANGFVVAVAAGVLASLVGGVTVGWRRALAALEMRMLGASIYPLALGYPLRRAILRLRSRFGKQKRYTWNS